MLYKYKIIIKLKVMLRKELELMLKKQITNHESKYL